MQQQAHSRNTRVGLGLFAVYTVVYASFVLVNAFAAKWGDWIVVAGLNLAIVWGFGLIGLAFLLALIYGFVCRTETEQEVSDNGEGGDE